MHGEAYAGATNVSIFPHVSILAKERPNERFHLFQKKRSHDTS